MAEESSLTTCLQYVCGWKVQEVAAIVNQGYNNTRFFRSIFWYRFTELLLENIFLESMKVSSNQNIQALRVCLKDLNPKNIKLVMFYDAILESQCDYL